MIIFNNIFVYFSSSIVLRSSSSVKPFSISTSFVKDPEDDDLASTLCCLKTPGESCLRNALETSCFKKADVMEDLESRRDIKDAWDSLEVLES